MCGLLDMETKEQRKEFFQRLQANLNIKEKEVTNCRSEKRLHIDSRQ